MQAYRCSSVLPVFMSIDKSEFAPFSGKQRQMSVLGFLWVIYLQFTSLPPPQINTSAPASVILRLQRSPWDFLPCAQCIWFLILESQKCMLPYQIIFIPVYHVLIFHCPSVLSWRMSALVRSTLVPKNWWCWIMFLSTLTSTRVHFYTLCWPGSSAQTTRN